MTALIQTIDTADGPFTLLVDDEQRVLASGWTADHGGGTGCACSRRRTGSVWTTSWSRR